MIPVAPVKAISGYPLASLILEPIGYRDPVKKSWTPPPQLIIPIMKT